MRDRVGRERSEREREAREEKEREKDSESASVFRRGGRVAGATLCGEGGEISRVLQKPVQCSTRARGAFVTDRLSLCLSLVTDRLSLSLACFTNTFRLIFMPIQGLGKPASSAPLHPVVVY